MKIIILQLINYTLSFLMWMILGRIVVTLITGGKPTFITGLFQKITDPVYGFVRKTLPFVKESCIPATSIIVIILLRFALILVFQPTAAR